ncbi:MAG TPA: DUF4215 domain-containing protein, partial [Polyangiaceae bacterium]|nr:DUF4215 domain-containing protein [Polyangiaceae bacterium]
MAFRRMIRGSTASLACLSFAFVVAGCSVDTEGLFGDATGSGGGGQGGNTSTTGSMTTDSTTTDSTTTGSMTTGSMTTGSMTTGSMTTGSMTSTAAGAMCGDGTLDPGEECDGSDLGGANCTDLGFTNPSGAKCTATCTLDYGDCASVCGNGNVEPDEECDDGNTSSAYDGCSGTCHLLGTSCADAIPIALQLGTMTLSGSTTLVDDAFQPQQTMGCGDSSGGDLVFAISPATSGFVTAWLPRAATTFDSVAYIRQSCDDPTSQVLCNDNYV